jgi:hypothetical protein
VGFAVVLVLSGGVELHGEGISFLSELVVHGDLFLVNSGWDGIFIEDNIVGSSLVVGPVMWLTRVVGGKEIIELVTER